VERMKEKNEQEYSATCKACGWGEGGAKRKGQMRRAAAKKGGGGGAKKRGGCGARPKEGADAARSSKREHGGAVTTMKWWCERPDGGARWRDGETTEESGEALLTLPQRSALLTISGPWCGVCTVQWLFFEDICKRCWKNLYWLACGIHLDQSDLEPSNAETWMFLIERADGIFQSNGLEGDLQTNQSHSIHATWLHER